jgi:hypothetical protein
MPWQSGDVASAPTTKVTDRFPSKSGVEVLFKYRPCPDDLRFERLTQLLCGSLYFSPLREFNDPFEGKPKYVQAFEDDNKQKEAYRKDYKRIAKARGVPGRERYETAERLRHRKVDVKGFGEPQLQKMLLDDCYVFSMSSKSDHPLMWSHYADQHRGVCVHFAAQAAPFAVALSADYSSQYPTIPVPLFGDHDLLMTVTTLRKADYWSYESEYRLVSLRDKNASWHLGLEWDIDRRIAQINPVTILGLTLGACMPSDMRAKIRGWRDASRENLTLFDARLSDTEFRVEVGPGY